MKSTAGMLPHYMFYAPNVKDSDSGGTLVSSTVRMIGAMGETEKAKILLEFKDLLADLCSYRDYLCTDDKTHMQMPTKTGAP